MGEINGVKRKIYKGIAVFYTALFFLFSFGSVPVYAIDSNANSATSQEGKYSDYSFYNMSSVIANTVNNCFVEGEKTIGEVFGVPNRGQAGAFLGFPDVNLGNEATGYFYTNTSKSEVTVSYRQIANIGNSSNSIGRVIGYADAYAALGAVLAETGCDSTDLGSALPMERKLLGGLLYLLFNMSRIVNKLFAAALKFLQAINPFAFFNNLGAVSNDGVVVQNNFGNGFGSSIFGGKTLNAFSNLYRNAQKLGLSIAVFFFAFILVFFFLNKTVFAAQANKPFNHGSMLKKWIIRLLFIFWGIPILGFAYTASLDSMIKALTDEGEVNMNAAKVVQSILCDFYDFAVNPNDIDDSFKLADPITYRVDEDYNVRYAGGSVMVICHNINKSSHSSLGNMGASLNASHVSDIIKDLQEPDTDINGVNEDYTSNIISMYMNGDQFSAGDYNNLWVSQHWQDPDHAKKITEFVKSFSSVAVVMDENTTLGAEAGNVATYGARFAVLDTLNPLHDGSAGSMYGMPNDPGIFLTKGTRTIPAGFKLSPLAAFNYLNTTFNTNSMTITSSTQALASASRSSHNKVNLVGHGIGALINYSLCVVMIITEVIIAIFYAFSLLFGNLKRGVRMLISVPGAFLGSIASIARVITYTVVMIVEVVATILIYSLACEIIYNIGIFLSTEVFEKLAELAVSNAAANNVIKSGLLSPVQTIVSLFVIIMYIWLIFVLIRMRKPIIKAIDSVADNVVNSFMMNVQNSTPTGAAVTKGLNNLSNPSAQRGLVGKAENQVNRSLAAVVGGGAQGGSAIADEYISEANIKGKHEAAKAKRKAIATGTTQAAAGVGAVVVGASTGNVGLVAGGVQSAVNGVGNVAGSNNVANDIQQTHSNAAVNAVRAENAGQAGAMNQTKTGLDDYGKEVQADMNKSAVNSLVDSGKNIAYGGIMGASGGASAGGTAATQTVGATAGSVESVVASNGAEVVTEVPNANVTSQMSKLGMKSMGNSHEVPLPEMSNSHMQQKENITIDKQANIQINQTNANAGGVTPTRLVGGKSTNVAQQMIDNVQQNIFRSQKQAVTDFNNAVDQSRRNAMTNITNGKQQSTTVHDGMNLNMVNDQTTSYSQGVNNVSGSGEGGLHGQLNQALNKEMHISENINAVTDRNITMQRGQTNVDYTDTNPNVLNQSATRTARLSTGNEGGLGKGGVNAAANKRDLKQ